MSRRVKKNNLPLTPEARQARATAKRLVRRWMGEIGSNEELLARLETMIARALLRAVKPRPSSGGRLVLARRKP